MTTLICIAAWLACSRVAFLLFRRDWLREFDLTHGDRSFFAFLSIVGPISLAAALLVSVGSGSNSDEVLIQRKGDAR